MNIPCAYPDRADYPDLESPPEERGEEWKTSEFCLHDSCIEIAGYAAGYAAGRSYRESLALAREDLDLPHATEGELLNAIQLGLK